MPRDAMRLQFGHAKFGNHVLGADGSRAA
eukprot:SAG11_NODE_13083_length_671_cov_1.031469_1_plen_28_part_10